MPEFRYAVSVMPKAGILDPQGRAVEQSLPHLDVSGVRDVRVGRRVELTVEAADRPSAEEIVRRLAAELLSNPLIETFELEAAEESIAHRAAPAGATGVGGGEGSR